MIRGVSDLVFLIGTICLVFITIVTAPYLGITQVTTFSTLIIFLYSINFLFNNPKVLSEKNNESLIFYSIVVIIIAFKIAVLNDFILGIYYLKNWLTPVIILIYFENIKSNKRNILKKILIIFFICECFLSIYERLTSTLVLGSLEALDLTEFQDDKIEDLKAIFRSQSLLGNPLNNAHLVCIMIGIILNSSIDLKYTYLLLITAILSILCFNARAASVIIFLVAMIYFQMIRKKLNSKQINYFWLIFGAGITIILYLMFNTSLGGRLLGRELIDGSAKERFRAFDIFWKFYNVNDPLLGDYSIPNIELTENGYLNLMITLGLPFAFVFILAQILMILSRLRNLNFLGKAIILFCFFVVGFSNNNLSQPDSLMMLFIWTPAFIRDVFPENRLFYSKNKS
jgi:hypothetical protein